MNNKIEFIDFMKLAALVFFGLWFVINMGAQVYGIREGSIPSLPTNIISLKTLTNEIIIQAILRDKQ